MEATLTSGPRPVQEIEFKARAAGLLLDQQTITDAKAFKVAKKQLGIRSARNSFGRGGEWFWRLPKAGAKPSTGQTDHLSAARKPAVDTYARRVGSECDASERSASDSSAQPLIAGEDRDPAVLTWVSLVDQLDYGRPPGGIPIRRWAALLTDTHLFLDSPFADRAAWLGWTAADLFGFSPVQPLMHLGSAGLLWILNGGQIVELHRDWALIQALGSQRVVDRRRADERGIVLPWTLRQHIGGAN